MQNTHFLHINLTVLYFTEPILQWLHKLGTYVNINKTMSEIKDLAITKSPCASDVAIVGVIYRKKDTGKCSIL